MTEHVDMATADLCRHPVCGSRWTTQLEWADGWTAFMCDDHWDAYAADDPEHGRLVSATGSWGVDPGPAAQRMVSSFAATDLHGRARRTARRKAERKVRRGR